MASITKMLGNEKLGLASLAAYIGALSFGYTIGYSSPALPDMKRSGIIEDDQLAAWFGSLATVGAIIGGPIAGWLVERLGRKKTLLVAAFPFMIGWLLIFLGEHSSDLLLSGRCLTGLGCGMITVASPLYIAETSTKELRGTLGSGVQLILTFGILLAYFFGMICSWKKLAIIGFLFPVASVFLVQAVPDTPRWYLIHNAKPAALEALRWLRGPQADVDEECRDIEESLPGADEKISWTDFTRPELMRPLKVAVGLMVFQQLSGINAVMFYTVSIFESAGLKESSASATVVIGIVQVLATFVACMLMDKAGRRKLLLFAGTGMALMSFVFGWYYYATTGSKTPGSLSWLPVFSLVVYIVAFSLGWGPIPMLLMSEIFPVKARGSASAVAATSNWFCAFVVTREFAPLQEVLGQYGVFWLFGVICSMGVGFVWKYVPETKGKSLEDIELYFLGRAIRGI